MILLDEIIDSVCRELSGVWSDSTSDLTMQRPCLYLWKCSDAMCFSCFTARVCFKNGHHAGFSFITAYMVNTPGSVRSEISPTRQHISCTRQGTADKLYLRQAHDSIG